MKITVKQIECEGNNRFEIAYNDRLTYVAQLPFVSISDPLNLEKIRKIRVYDLKDQEVYRTDYQYIKNLQEGSIPLKYLITGSQKANQVLFISNKNVIKIYYEALEFLNSRYVMEMNGKTYYCYSVEDGYIRHLPIYDNDIQIGEILKSNITNDALDEYCAYVKDEYACIRDGIMSLLLFLDRKEYNSSYLVNRSSKLEVKYSFSKNNKYYDKNWVKDHFGDEFYKTVDEQASVTKEKLKHPIKTSMGQWASLPPKQKKLMKWVLIGPWVLCGVIMIFVGFIFIMNSL